MTEHPKQPPDDPISADQSAGGVRSFKHLIEIVTGRGISDSIPEEESGLAESLPFPFLAIVGQTEMKLALLLNLINPAIGGVLLLGPRGTGKSTAVRSLVQLTPQVQHSLCYYGCTDTDVENLGMDSVCPDCARRYAEGQPLTHWEDMRLVELPLNAEIEDVVGGLDERAAVHQRMRLRRGILSYADRNILYVDEVNLLKDDIVNVILDAAAMGTFTVRRGAISATYYARFNLIGTMNPEEGHLRPQIMDRFGLRVLVNGLKDAEDRWQAYQRVSSYKQQPGKLISAFSDQTNAARDEISRAQQLLPRVTIPEETAKAGLHLIQSLQIASLRAEITLFEAARAYAAADDRTQVSLADLTVVAPLALRMRQSSYMDEFLSEQHQQEEQLNQRLNELANPKDKPAP